MKRSASFNCKFNEQTSCDFLKRFIIADSNEAIWMESLACALAVSGCLCRRAKGRGPPGRPGPDAGGLLGQRQPQFSPVASALPWRYGLEEGDQHRVDLCGPRGDCLPGRSQRPDRRPCQRVGRSRHKHDLPDAPSGNSHQAVCLPLCREPRARHRPGRGSLL